MLGKGRTDGSPPGMDSVPDPPPEAVLIYTGREAAGLTITEAARKVSLLSPDARISTARWSQIENGYEVRAGGAIREVTARPGMLAHMARVSGVTPGELRETGRENAVAAAGIL